MSIEVVALDADDTLWHNEPLFLDTKTKFQELLSANHSAEWIEERLYETEVRNLEHFGYGIKSFTLSMIETAVELTEGRIRGSDVQSIVDFAKSMVDRPVHLIDHVEETVKTLAATFPLVLVTKGDLFDQESKIARSGLGELFRSVEVVTTKDRSTYETITNKLDVAPDGFLMVGDSLKSDILPVLDMGGNAIHVPYDTTWKHEEIPVAVLEGYEFQKAVSIREVPGIIGGLC